MDDAELVEALRPLAGFAGSWWIAGGWAIDLACPAPVRHHKDVDVLVRDDQTDILFDQLESLSPCVEHPQTGERRSWRRTDELGRVSHTCPVRLAALWGSDDAGEQAAVPVRDVY